MILNLNFWIVPISEISNLVNSEAREDHWGRKTEEKLIYHPQRLLTNLGPRPFRILKEFSIIYEMSAERRFQLNNWWKGELWNFEEWCKHFFSKWFHWHIDYRQRRRNLEFECTKRIRFEVVNFAANKSLTNPNYHRMSVAILYEKLMPIWDFRNINQHFFFLIFLFEILTESRSQQNFIHFHFHS